uniref:Uncharacterized protein n=1 Tax=Setaria viridis TaxID=4556 RepID=A0A4U6V7P9_SETVI|nr:hypothetical protein SEVIR_4G051701v2 [Setaria viridis]
MEAAELSARAGGHRAGAGPARRPAGRCRDAGASPRRRSLPALGIPRRRGRGGSPRAPIGAAQLGVLPGHKPWDGDLADGSRGPWLPRRGSFSSGRLRRSKSTAAASTGS